MASKLPPQTQPVQPGLESEMHPEPDCKPRFPGAGRLAGQVALISGGDSGIGRAVAVAMAREGASVALLHTERERGDAIDTIEMIEAEGSHGLSLAGDIGEEAFCRHAVEATIARFGRLDILVNNAAEQHPQDDLTAIDAGQLERTFRTNVFGYFFLTKAALPHLGQGAAIVNTTSVTAYKGSGHLIDYAATRGAIVAFTRSLADSLVSRGIRVNGVAPGPIWTPLIPASFPPDRVAEHGSSTPMKRPGQPNEVASCYVFLASKEASYMTGQILHPNGGTPVSG